MIGQELENRFAIIRTHFIHERENAHLIMSLMKITLIVMNMIMNKHVLLVSILLVSVTNSNMKMTSHTFHTFSHIT